jgi:hypothetical protein
MLVHLISFLAPLVGIASAQCPDYLDYATLKHSPYSEGVRNLSYQRPDPACRTFSLPLLEDKVLLDVMHATPDPDLFRLFLNGSCRWPSIGINANTL